jgi:hypothetical protein
MAGESLFDTLAGGFGHAVNRPALEAFVANSQANNGLRTAQTDVAIGNAQKQQEEFDAHNQIEAGLGSLTGADGKPIYTPSDVKLLKNLMISHFGNAPEVVKSLQEGQTLANQRVLSDPSQIGSTAATAAMQGNTNKIAEPVALPDNYVAPPGVSVDPQQSPQGVAHTQLTNAQTQQALAGASLKHTQANAASQPSSLSDDAAYSAATRYNRYGTLPSLGMGAAGANDRKKILNFAAELSQNPDWHPPAWDAPPANGAAPQTHITAQQAADTAANPADAKAQTAMMSDMTKRAAVADAAEQTVLRNMSIVRETLGKADQSGSPFINTLENKVRQGLMGDPDVSAYQNALTTMRNEYARVVSMATGAQGLTDHAMKEGYKLFPDGLAPSQFEANAQIAQREMGNRTGSMHDQIAQARSTLRAPAHGAGSVGVVNTPDVSTAGGAQPATSAGADQAAARGTPTYHTEADAEAAAAAGSLKPGTKIIVNGVSGTWH